MACPQWSPLVHEYINLDANTVTSVVHLEALEALNEWCKAVCHEHHLAFYAFICGFSSKTGNVFKTSASPVVDDVQRKAGCTERIEPPDIDLGTDEREQKRQGIEVDICGC